MTKAELQNRSQLTQREIAELFGITPGAVSQWPDHEPLPELRILQLQRLRPEYFRAPKEAALSSEVTA